jgi:hypothetical protein
MRRPRRRNRSRRLPARRSVSEPEREAVEADVVGDAEVVEPLMLRGLHNAGEAKSKRTTRLPTGRPRQCGGDASPAVASAGALQTTIAARRAMISVASISAPPRPRSRARRGAAIAGHMWTGRSAGGRRPPRRGRRFRSRPATLARRASRRRRAASRRVLCNREDGVVELVEVSLCSSTVRRPGFTTSSRPARWAR